MERGKDGTSAGWKQSAGQPLGAVTRHSLSSRGAQTARPSFPMGLEREHKVLEGKLPQESGGLPRKTILTEQPQLI